MEIFGFEDNHECITQYVEAVEHNSWTFEVHFDTFSVFQTVWGILYLKNCSTFFPYQDILRILNSENCSKTGLNCAITCNVDYGAGVGGSGPVGNGGVGGHQGPLDPTGLDLDINDNESETDHRIESVKVSQRHTLYSLTSMYERP